MRIPAGERESGLFASIDCGCGLTQVPVPLLVLTEVILLECSSGVGPMTFSSVPVSIVCFEEELCGESISDQGSFRSEA